jgi:SAM-dependent methyltransferase
MKKMKLVSRSCPTCSSNDRSRVYAQENYNLNLLDGYAFASRKVPENMHYRLIECPSCDTLYANPLPALKQLVQNYQEAAFDSSEEAHFAARTYAGQLPAIIKNIPNIQGAIDIGTGDGAFLEELLKKGFTKVAGVEPSKAPIRASLPQIKPLIKKGLFSSKSFKKNSMSLITCFQTFEHLYNPLKTCRESYEILKKEGAFYIVCHNRRSLSARILGMKSPIFDIEHLQLFSPQSARVLLAKAGFTGITVKPLFNAYPLHYWLKLLPMPKGLKLGLIQFLKKIKLGYLPIMLPAGNMVVIGYKDQKRG